MSFKSAVCERRSQRDDPVTGEPTSVHPMGHPMMNSQKRGLERRVCAENFVPAFDFRGGRRKEWELGGGPLALIAWAVQGHGNKPGIGDSGTQERRVGQHLISFILGLG